MDTSGKPDAGTSVLRAHHPVNETIDRLTTLLKERGIRIFGCIDFSADATDEGLSMLRHERKPAS